MAEKKAAEDAEERRLEAERKKEEEARLERCDAASFDLSTIYADATRLRHPRSFVTPYPTQEAKRRRREAPEMRAELQVQKRRSR